MKKKQNQKKHAVGQGAGKGQGYVQWLFPILCSVVIFVLAIWGIDQFHQFLLFDDEFGYWTGSAYLTGTDWKSVASGIPYYSYGYGMLVLTPIRLLISSPPLMYKAAIVVNALFLVASFWLARYVTKQLYPDCAPLLRDGLCFLCQVYSCYLVFSHIAWAECLLVFAFWVFVWLSLRVIQKPGIWNHVGIAVNAVALYVIHQRTLSVIIATVMIMILLFVREKERRKDVIVFGMTLGGLLFLHSLLKTDLLGTYYQSTMGHSRIILFAIAACVMALGLFFVDPKRRRILIAMAAVALAGGLIYYLTGARTAAPVADNARVQVNDFAGQLHKLRSIFTWDGFVSLFQSIVGKWFYLTMSTCLLIWWSMEKLFAQSIAYIRQLWAQRRPQDAAAAATGAAKKSAAAPKKTGKKAGKKTKEQETVGELTVWYIWLLLMFLGNFMIAAIYMIDVTRNDILLYGRYTEHMLGIYIIIGAMVYLRDKYWVGKTMVYVCVAGISGVICEYVLDRLGLTSYQAYHSMYTSLFLQKDVPPYDAMYYFTAFGIGVSLAVLLLLRWRGPGKQTWIPRTLILVPLTVLFCKIAYGMVFDTMASKQDLRVYNIISLVEALQQVDGEAGNNIYYCRDTEARYWSESFQFLMPDTPVTVIDTTQVDPEEEAFYITGDDFVGVPGYAENFYCIGKSYQFAVSVGSDTELAKRARKLAH
ncbi:MAG: hypothetical protein IJ747_06910 [Lachnospiraceae bacterium]|nr:hypothetical protein [Lachnospiraceae bacterium]